MAQLTIYLPDEIEKKVRLEARRAKKSVSAYIADLATRRQIDCAPHAWLTDLLKAQFSLRMQIATQQLSNNSQLKKTRRDIARVRTIIAQKAASK